MKKIEFEIESFDDIESALIEILELADEKLDEKEFHQLAESIIDSIDSIGRSKRPKRK